MTTSTRPDDDLDEIPVVVPDGLRRLTSPRGRPIHPALGSVAIGAWVSSLGFDAFSQVSSSEFIYARGAYVLTAIGVAAAIVAATVGLIDLLQLDRGTAPFRVGVRHLLAMDTAIVVFTISFLIRRTSDFDFHDSVGPVPMALTVIGLVAIAVGLYFANDVRRAVALGAKDEVPEDSAAK